MDIRRVGWTNLHTFLSLPRRIHARLPDTRWVPPLDVLTFFSMGGLGGADKSFFLAYRDGQPVARAGFKVHRHGDYAAIHFGFFEAMPDAQAEVQELIERGHQLAPRLPMRGPHSFRLEDPYTALLIEGFDRDPYFFMAYNPPYYLELLENAGFAKAMDLLTYRYVPDALRLDAMRQRAERARERGITVVRPSGSRRQQVRTLVDLFNVSLSQNWGFEPIEGEQFEEFVLLARAVLNEKLIRLALRDGQCVGAVILLPNLNPMLKASGGRLGPTLFYKYLTRERWVDSYRGYALAVHPDAQDDYVAAVLIDDVFQAAAETRFREAEVSWVLESNTPMRALAMALGGKKNCVYRVLERPPL